jgi:hypothetical protein
LPSVVAIVRDEGPYLAEWVAFHRLQGFDRFLIYDNESSDDGPELAESLGCEVLSWPGEVQQLPAYHDALNRLDDKAWAAFIDVDEYLWCPNGSRVVEELGRAAGDAIGAPWRMFGHSGHYQRPAGLTIENYTQCAAVHHKEVKQILRPGLARTWLDPHHTDLPFQRSQSIVCNHYWTRSYEECRAKFARGRADVAWRRSLQEFHDTAAALSATVDRRCAERWGTPLQRRLTVMA